MDKQKIDAFADKLKSVGLKTAKALRELLEENEKSADPICGARGVIGALFDPGTFSEIGKFVRRRSTDNEEDGFESVITGWGAVNGQLVYVFAQDISKMSGAVSESHAKKICEVYRLAVQNGAPVVGLFNSAGVSVSEGVRALSAYGKIMKSVASASGVIPQIAVVNGYASGASAVICGMFDILITTEKGEVSVNSAVSVDGAGSADSIKKNGTSAISVADEAEAVTAVKEILNLIPSNNAEGAPTEASIDPINRLISIADYESSSDAHDLIKSLADDGKLIELYGGYAQELVTGLFSIGGSSAVVVATNKSVNSGVLSAVAARKASRAVSFADSFNLPVVTLVDSCGYDKSADSEEAPYLAELAKLAGAYAAAHTPIVTVIVGEAYGTAFTLLGSKALGADVVYALDKAKIAAMNASSAVAFLWNEKITPEVSRADLEEEWNNTVATPVEAASSGDIDDIISECELRQRIGAAIYMLSAKSAEQSSRRHLIMPL